ncbi:hypothetical protein ANN_07271 [Periplaneta americana]|uniref:Uncharacterized protein n=1 Tax=Periplaneta americana TaxID=6978 RepID=A0ABQ8TGR1_PERAM|nr:hypothetical protein ANN_07271 [Periplaneta americana]
MIAPKISMTQIMRKPTKAPTTTIHLAIVIEKETVLDAKSATHTQHSTSSSSLRGKAGVWNSSMGFVILQPTAQRNQQLPDVVVVQPLKMGEHSPRNIYYRGYPNGWIERAGDQDIFSKWPPRFPDFSVCDYGFKSMYLHSLRIFQNCDIVSAVPISPFQQTCCRACGVRLLYDGGGT